MQFLSKVLTHLLNVFLPKNGSPVEHYPDNLHQQNGLFGDIPFGYENGSPAGRHPRCDKQSAVFGYWIPLDILRIRKYLKRAKILQKIKG
jgi:hypothetical protein